MKSLENREKQAGKKGSEEGMAGRDVDDDDDTWSNNNINDYDGKCVGDDEDNGDTDTAAVTPVKKEKTLSL